MTAGQRIGYIRISSASQSLDRQLEGIQLDRIFKDAASAKDTDRPGLQSLLSFVREGDVVIVHSLDRFARDLGDLRKLVADLTRRGIRIEFIKEGLTFSGDDTRVSKLMPGVMGSFAEFERALIRERQREGIAPAKKKGVYKGRKKALTLIQVAALQERIRSGEKKARLAAEFGISRQTLYEYLHQERLRQAA
jgi:DNA invertase Pin-like site-specific DNA recombinase